MQATYSKHRAAWTWYAGKMCSDALLFLTKETHLLAVARGAVVAIVLCACACFMCVRVRVQVHLYIHVHSYLCAKAENVFYALKLKMQIV